MPSEERDAPHNEKNKSGWEKSRAGQREPGHQITYPGPNDESLICSRIRESPPQCWWPPWWPNNLLVPGKQVPVRAILRVSRRSLSPNHRN